MDSVLPHDPTDRPSDHYTIRIRGHLEPRWANWFDELTLTREDEGTTLLSGFVADQAALHGVFNKIRDLGLVILSVQWNETKA